MLLMRDVIVADRRQVVVVKQALQVTDVVNRAPQRLYLYYIQIMLLPS